MMCVKRREDQNLQEVRDFQTHDKLITLGNKVRRTRFEARKVAGSAKYKQSKTVCSCVVFKVSLFIQS